MKTIKRALYEYVVNLRISLVTKVLMKIPHDERICDCYISASEIIDIIDEVLNNEIKKFDD